MPFLTPFTGSEPLSDTAIMERTPSVFARSPGPHVSERYSFIPTSEVIGALHSDGWNVVDTRQTGDWRTPLKNLEYPDEEIRRQCAKHQVTLARPEHLQQLSIVGEAAPRLILTNAHDGQAAYRLYGGLFRLVCKNGLVVGEKCLPMIRIRHTSTTVEEAVAGARQIQHGVNRLGERAAAFRTRTLDEREALTFATEALALRHGPSVPGKLSIDPQSVLSTRRVADAGLDLWHVFNRVQERVIRGGYDVTRFDPEGHRRIQVAREVRAVDELIRLNRELWELADDLALVS